MSEKLLDRALRRTQESNDRALTRAAEAEARLHQAQDLLTALGIPLSTDPKENERSRAPLAGLYSSAPRALTLAERIIIACRRGASGIDANMPPEEQGGEAPRGGLYRVSVDNDKSPHV